MFSCALLLASCHDQPTENTYMSKGTITGPDLRECACCGGWFITIDSMEYLFYTLPPGSNLDLTNETFPLKVQLNWHKPDHPCLSDLIEVDAIAKE